MDVEHTTTEAAEEALHEETADYADRLRETAVNEALTSRGKPVEVTASDVRRAAQTLRKIRTEEVAERYRGTYRIMTAYLWAGVAMAALSLLLLGLPFQDLGIYLPVSERLLGMLGLTGAFLAAASGVTRWYLLKTDLRQS